uniref:fibrillin-2-like isoform X3 n=1 Tax=Ciona intestinalis TaxID=7719 RepID=UPI000EF510BA|nr:fibrillin-2-like isoform X3 [Ciona intestinalis]|eukprot:XP_026689970.1 fibrillin-2-like isoform X3 [Ciona intestinalis]
MLKTVLLAACVLITASSSAQSTCQDTTSEPLTGTYEKPSDSRYLFLSSSRSTYHDAVASCSMRGGKLYSLPSLPDTSFTEMLGKYSGVGAQGYILNNGSQCLGSTSGSPGVGNCIKIYRTSSAAAFSCSSTGCCDKLQFICEVPEACMYCSLNGTCTDSGNCSCNAGYKREGIACIDINECSANPCLASQVCVNTLGSHRCADEYRTIIDQRVGAYNGSKEWTDMYDSNIQNATKMAWVGVTGYQRQTSASLLVYDDILVARYTVLHITQNGNVSDLIRSYKTKHGDVFFSEFDLETPVKHNQNCCASCGPNKSCTSRLGEVTCKCQIGFTSSSSEDMDSCDDIDECANSTKFSCPAHSACKNTLGSYYCGECLKGYTGSPHNCSDINECTSGTHNCSSNSFCVNTNGSYICNCPTGYSGIHCTNIDGCLAANLRCNESQFCDKQDGSFVCRVGYPRRFDQLLAGLNASDFNNKTSDSYAKLKTMITNDLQTLWNVSNGMVQVSDFFSSGGKLVVRYDVYTFDIHEFHKDLIASYVSRNTVTPKYPYQAEVPKAYFNCCGSCGQNAKCQTFLGNVSCQCLSGFYGSPPNCTDNQCLTSSSPCSSNANCTKTEANYSCACHSGFVGNGTFCYPSTCKTAPKMCHHNALCKQDGENWNCECKPGFYGDPISNCTDIDECTDDDGKCHQNASCTNNIGNYTCSCRTGFNGNGSFCEDIDECSTNVSNCHHKATCNNTVGSYTCICMTGYYKNGTGCFDIDECKGSSHKCNRSASCRNTPGSYNCSCNSGYNGDGFTCDDVNECDEAKPRCHTNATCINKPGSYECKCKDGYDGNGTHSCIDRNECAGGNCHQNASCINEVNSFTCVCNSGFTGNGTNCTDTNECSNSTLNQCHVNAACVNTPGSHHCSCMSGFSGSGEDCQDINECENKTDNCDSNANCTNNVGSFTCTCHDGFHGNGPFCTDIDECSNSSLNGCHSNATCHNQPGSYNCTCKAGFTGDGKTCRDVKECLNSTLNQCHVNATCVDTPGSHHCSCVSGFSGSGEDCQDINECENKTDNCDSNANCTNNVGSFTCTCHDGFHGNGSFCTVFLLVDIDECSNSSLNECHTNATCHNGPGSYNCTCKAGFTGDGKTCRDKNECTGKHVCPPNSNCTNTPGSYACICIAGFFKNGTMCSDINECETGNFSCHANAECINAIGTYCCVCKQNFTGHGSNCTELDCSNGGKDCSSNGSCMLKGGKHVCKCNMGYKGDGYSCIDMNECLDSSKNSCHIHANCTNTVGSYSCMCHAGYTGNGKICTEINECEHANCSSTSTCVDRVDGYTCVCKDGFTGKNCTDIDECKNASVICEQNEMCVNNDGSYMCICKPGYATSNCTDVNECNNGEAKCHSNATCNNTMGNYTCTCYTGFIGDGYNCIDRNECSADNACSANATCTNHGGGYTCTCKSGFSGDGHTCTDINECSSNPCHENAYCNNTDGSYTCTCKKDYSGDGKSCQLLLHCSTNGVFECHKYASCVSDNNGQYSCKCNPGFQGDGTTCSGICNLQVYQNLTFNETQVPFVQASNEKCSNGLSKATAVCTPGTNGLFSFAKLKSIPCNASLLSLENGNAEETTATIQVLTSHAENISTSEVSVVVDYFVNITDNNQNETISTATFYSAASISSNLITKFFKTPDTPNNKENTKLRNNLVQSLTKLARSVELEPDDPLVVETDTVVIKVLQSSTDTTTLRFKPVVTSGNNITRTPVNVVLPSTVLQKAWGTTATRAKRETNGGRASFMLYIDDSLFPSSSNVTTVVEIDLGVEFVTGLQDPVKIEHYDKGGTLYGQTETEDTFTVVETVYSCEYWDFNKNDWSSEGCCFNYTSNPPECLCTHLTNFALIMKNNNAPADLALSVISDIGCILSIIGLFATIVIHAEDRDLRRRRPTKILLNICGNLMIAYLIFVVGIDHPKQKNACIAVTYLLHYFFLTSWCWMSVYSYDMYMSLVKVFRGNEHNFLQWCSLFAYGTPLVIASITVGVTVGYLDNLPQAVKNNLCGDVIDPLKKSTYHASNICWLNGPALYIGFLIPITICFVGNFAIFVCVLKEIIEKNSKVEVSSMKRTVKQNMIFAVTMTSIMGLTWVFGYLLLLSDNEAYLTAMSWIFALFNTLQGVGIFVLTAMRRPRFRKLWKNSTSAVTSSHALSVFRGTDTLRSEDASTATTDMNHRE